MQHGLREQAILTASHSAPDVTAVHILKRETGEIKSLLDTLSKLVGLPLDYFDGRNLADIERRVGELVDNLPLVPGWAAFEEVRQRVAGSVLAELMPLAMTEQIP